MAAGTPATTLLRKSAVAHTLHEYTHDPAHPSFGLEAAEALGVEPARVFKTLIAEVDGKPTVGVVPVSAQLDLKALAIACGTKRAVMADPTNATRITGYVVGGISPLGQRKKLPCVIDASALEHDTIFVSGGRRGLDIELRGSDLVELTDAVVAAIASHDH